MWSFVWITLRLTKDRRRRQPRESLLTLLLAPSSSAGDYGRRANFNLLETDGKKIMYSKSWVRISLPCLADCDVDCLSNWMRVKSSSEMRASLWNVPRTVQLATWTLQSIISHGSSTWWTNRRGRIFIDLAAGGEDSLDLIKPLQEAIRGQHSEVVSLLFANVVR